MTISVMKAELQTIGTPKPDTNIVPWADGQVFDMVPPKMRQKYPYWRGASIGAIVCNFLNGNETLNAGSDQEMHFTKEYPYAALAAKCIAQNRGLANLQFAQDRRQELDGIIDLGRPIPTAGIVFALGNKYQDYYMRPSDKGACEGFIWDGDVTLDMIDPHSRKTLQEIIDSL